MPTPSILVVDDDRLVFQALQRALYREHHEMLFAPDASKALELLAQRSVDVAIVDEKMPGMSGTELLTEIGRRWPDVVCMMLTGHCSLETAIAAVNRGELFRFFVKPANEAEIIIAIRDGIARRKTLQRSGGMAPPARAPQKLDPSAARELPPIKLPDRNFGPTRSR